jgi:hypothetical protein
LIYITHHASRITHHASRITHHASRITHHASRITHQVEYLAEERCGIVATHMLGAQALRQASRRKYINRKERKERKEMRQMDINLRKGSGGLN